MKVNKRIAVRWVILFVIGIGVAYGLTLAIDQAFDLSDDTKLLVAFVLGFAFGWVPLIVNIVRGEYLFD